MAEVIRYVDPDATGTPINGTTWSQAYRSLSAWEAAEQTNLVTAGDWHHVYVRSSGGTADTTPCVINGWTTGAANYILIEAADGDQAVKTSWDVSRYRLEVANADALTIWDDHVRVDGLQVGKSSSSAHGEAGITIGALAVANDIRIYNCRVRQAGNNSYQEPGIEVNDTDAIVLIYNCMSYGQGTAVSSSNASITILASATVDIYNCVTMNGYRGVYRGGGTVTVKNSAVFNHPGSDFNGTITVDYCASDDDTGTNNVVETGGGASWTGDFQDAANGDFTLLTGSGLKLAGTNVSLATDIDGDAYHATTPSVGVDEYVAGGTSYTVFSSDGLSLGDSPVGFLSMMGMTTDGVTMSDASLASLAAKAVLSEGLTLSDSAIGPLSAKGYAADGLVLSESLLAFLAAKGFVADGITLSDAALGAITYLMSVADGITLSDSSAGKIGLKVTLADGVSLGDAITAAMTFVGAASDGVKFSDSATTPSGITGLLTVTITGKRGSVTITGAGPGSSITRSAPGANIS